MCKECEYVPTTYEEYCMKSKCPDAYTEKSKECGNNKMSQGFVLFTNSETMQQNRNNLTFYHSIHSDIMVSERGM